MLIRIFHARIGTYGHDYKPRSVNFGRNGFIKLAPARDDQGHRNGGRALRHQRPFVVRQHGRPQGHWHSADGVVRLRDVRLKRLLIPPPPPPLPRPGGQCYDRQFFANFQLNKLGFFLKTKVKNTFLAKDSSNLSQNAKFYSIFSAKL
jgi:hypothetical protein